jgi:hypothetical protein
MTNEDRQMIDRVSRFIADEKVACETRKLKLVASSFKIADVERLIELAKNGGQP